MTDTFRIYQLEGAFAGIAGRVVVVQDTLDAGVLKQTVYVWRWADASGDPFDVGKPLEKNPQIQQLLGPNNEVYGKARQGKARQGSELKSLRHAQYVALRLQTQDAYSAQIKNGPKLAWVCLTALMICTPLLLPGVYFTASIYVITSVGAVYVAALMENSPYLMTATRVATAVSFSAVLLAVLAWQHTYSVSDQIAAAFRVAVVIPVAFGVVSTTQWLGSVSTPMRVTGNA